MTSGTIPFPSAKDARTLDSNFEKRMSFQPPHDTRTQILDSVVSLCEQRFYDPKLHGIQLRELASAQSTDILTTPCFSNAVNSLLGELHAYPVEFFHESERRVGLWKVIKCSFHTVNGHWMFQDVLVDGYADRAGVKSGALLLEINGNAVDTPDTPKFPITPEVRVTFQNPNSAPDTFVFDPTAKEDENSTKYVVHGMPEPGIGYIRISKFPGLLGMRVAQATDAAIRTFNRPRALIVDIRGNLGSVGAGNLRLMGYFTPDKRPVGYSLTRARAEQGYRREDLAQFTQIPRSRLLAPLTLLKFKDNDKSIVVVTEGFGRQSFQSRIVMLVNEHTISGGEIVAGFASDHKLATLVGTATAGKLLGWSTHSLQDDCFLTLPTVNYLTWEGKSFEGTGVIPDIGVPFDPDAASNGIDTQLEAALNTARQL
jgi:carboxyl-terminal processing protease